MRLILDYGGVIVEHGDERDHAHLPGVGPETDPYPGWLASFAFRGGFVQRTAEYIDLLSTLTCVPGRVSGVSRGDVAPPRVPEKHRRVLRELAADHTLVLFSNTARPWVETVLSARGVRACFDTLVVSSDLRRPKPHPAGYIECPPEGDEPVAFVSDGYNADLLMAETFGLTPVWVETDDETPHREPDVRVSTLADVPEVISTGGRPPSESGAAPRHRFVCG